MVRAKMRPVLPPVIACWLVLGCGEAFAGFPGENGRIAYSESVGEDTSYDAVKTVLPSGRRTSNFFFGATDPAYSPNGRTVVVAGGSLPYPPFGRSGLFLARSSERGRPRRITRGLDENPAFAPRNGRIVFERNGRLRVYFRHRTRPLANGSDPAWSVGGLIAFENRGHIYVVRPGGGGLRRVTAGSAPNWSPDGRRIVYTLGTGPYRLATIRADGSGRRILARSRSSEYRSPCWSPDGRYIAFRYGYLMLRVIRSGGGRSRYVTEADEGLLSLDWQPLPGGG